MKRSVLILNLLILTSHLFAYKNFNSTLSETNKFSRNKLEHENAIILGATYIGDLANNISGGLNKGIVYLGLGNLTLNINTKNMGLWSGGNIYLNGASAHGKSPTENLIGDFQVASNIDAGRNILYIQEFWYKQSFTNLEFTIGIQDLNAEFATSQNSSEFINSSFGIAPVIADNVPCSIFPITGLGFTGKLKLNEDITIQMALFDGFPTGINNIENNTSRKIQSNDGFLYFTELQFTKKLNNLSSSYKIGYYYHSGLVEVNEETNLTSSIINNNEGYYFIADHSLLQKGNKSIGLFTQLSFSPSEINLHNKYVGAGFRFSGWFDKQHNNEIGIAIAYAGFNKELNHKHETLIEIYYNLPLNKNIYLKPDLQYIINPLGTETIIKNAMVLFLRFGIEF
ncbi:MAG: hypothetical protein GQ564_15790 [Bacteroidales bacterium]|nr:hypothetical protein [Bacteroidales bacterium]